MKTQVTSGYKWLYSLPVRKDWVDHFGVPSVEQRRESGRAKTPVAAHFSIFSSEDGAQYNGFYDGANGNVIV